MVTSRALYLAFLLAIGAERLFEVALSRRNAARAFARGGRESGQAHFPAMVALHTAFLASCALESGIRTFPGALGWAAVAAAMGAQALRYWAVASLGDRWNVRVIVVPGEPPVQSGPYRFMRHPNYLIVIGEIAVLPLVFGEVWVCIAFSVLNAALLAWRLREENLALAPRRTLQGNRG